MTRLITMPTTVVANPSPETIADVIAATADKIGLIIGDAAPAKPGPRFVMI